MLASRSSVPSGSSAIRPRSGLGGTSCPVPASQLAARRFSNGPSKLGHVPLTTREREDRVRVLDPAVDRQSHREHQVERVGLVLRDDPRLGPSLCLADGAKTFLDTFGRQQDRDALDLSRRHAGHADHGAVRQLDVLLAKLLEEHERQGRDLLVGRPSLRGGTRGDRSGGEHEKKCRREALDVHFVAPLTYKASRYVPPGQPRGARPGNCIAATGLIARSIFP
jgi:hypothetical protein